MTPDFHDRAAERDDTLIKGFCYAAARNTRLELREWAQTELNASLIEAQLQESRVEGAIVDQITSTVERLRFIDRVDLPEAIRVFDDMIADVSQGGFTDVYNAYDQMQKGCAGLVRIMRELLEIRSVIGEMGDI